MTFVIIITQHIHFKFDPIFIFKKIIKLAQTVHVYVVPPQSWGDQGDTKHSKCLLVGGRRLNQTTLIPKPKGSGGARAATAQVGPANKRNDTKRCLLFEASLRPGEAVSWSTTECPAVPNTSVQSCCRTSSPPGDVTYCFYSQL